MQKAKLITLIVVTVLFLIIVWKNLDAVPVKFPFVTFRISMAALLFGSLIVGFLIGVLVAGRLFREGKKSKEEKAKVIEN